VAVNITVSRTARSTILEHLRTLRASLARARDVLMHYKDDRVDRDTLEPAARRVDDLMNMFAGGSGDPARVILWSSEIRATLDEVPNPKAADDLLEARAEISAVLLVIEAEEKVSQGREDVR
jgi:hypothetical protein